MATALEVVLSACLLYIAGYSRRLCLGGDFVYDDESVVGNGVVRTCFDIEVA